jgi:hypothetical protein
LKGAIAVPVDPIYFESIATPSVEEAPPELKAYPKMPPPIVQTHRLSVVVGEVGSIPPVDALSLHQFVPSLKLAL